MEEAKVIQQWGAFYFLRLAADIKTSALLWYIEAVKIIVKILLLILAFVADIITGALYLIFILLKAVVNHVLAPLVSKIIEKILNLISFVLYIILGIGVLYLVYTHWSEFTYIIEKISNYVK